MTTSWDDGFLTTCSTPPGEQMTANVFAGTSINETAVPGNAFPDLSPVLDDDYSLNIWVKYLPASTGATHVLDSWIGLVDGSTRAVRTGWRLTSTTIRFQVSDGTTTVLGTPRTWPKGWHHWTWGTPNGWDTVSWYIDGILVETLNTAAIAGDHGNLFCPLVGLDTGAPTAFDLGASTDPGGNYPTSLTDPFLSTAFSHIPCVVGPAEFATQDTSASDMDANVRDRTVHPRDNTQFRVFWTEIENGPFEWDLNPRHIIRGISDFAGGAVPMNNVSITYTGGLALQTFISYGQAEPVTPYALIAGMRAHFAFVIDPFFDLSGNIPIRTL